MHKPILVVAAIIQNTAHNTGQSAGQGVAPKRSERKILLARRKIDASLEAGKWEFPGGKVEALEHPEETLRREIKEELDLTIEVERIFDVASHVYQTPSGPVHIVLLCYLCTAAQESFRLLEVSDARWVSPEQLSDFDYAAADIKTVERLKEFLGT